MVLSVRQSIDITLYVVSDDMDRVEQPERVSAESQDNLTGVFLMEGDPSGYYESTTLSGEIQEDDGNDFVFDNPFILDAQEVDPVESPPINFFLTSIFLDFEYEGGPKADDFDETEDPNVAEEEHTLDQTGTLLDDENPKDEDDEHANRPDTMEGWYYDKVVHQLHDYEYDDEMELNERRGDYPFDALEPEPELPLGHLTYHMACIDFYKSIIMFVLYTPQIPWRQKWSYIKFMLQA